MAKKLNMLIQQTNEMYKSTRSCEPEQAPEAEPKKDLIDEIEDQELKEAIASRRGRGPGRPKKSEEQKEKDNAEFQRFCSIGRRIYVAKLHEIAHAQGVTLKDLLDEMFSKCINAYEEKHGEVIVKEKKGNSKGLFS